MLNSSQCDDFLTQWKISAQTKRNSDLQVCMLCSLHCKPLDLISSFFVCWYLNISTLPSITWTPLRPLDPPTLIENPCPLSTRNIQRPSAVFLFFRAQPSVQSQHITRRYIIGIGYFVAQSNILQDCVALASREVAIPIQP